MVKIPIYKDVTANFTQNIVIDGVNVELTLTYNIRNGAWKMDLKTEKSTLYGVKLVVNSPLLLPYKAWIPEVSGDFIVLQTQDESSTFDYDDFGSIYALFYLTKDELEGWKKQNGLG